MKKIAVALGAGLTLLAGPLPPAQATTFAAWQVADVPWGDTLNVRKYPSSQSQKQSAYSNGTVLQMTGRCTDGIDLLSMASDNPDDQRAAVRYRWCEIWHDPGNSGTFATGWVYGRYISPL